METKSYQEIISLYSNYLLFCLVSQAFARLQYNSCMTYFLTAELSLAL